MADQTHGDGSDNPQSGGGSDSGDKQYMTTEQFNRAFTGMTKRFEKAFESKLESMLSDFASNIQAPSGQGEGGDDSGGDSGEGGIPPELANQFKSMKSRMTKLENDNKELRGNLQKERQTASMEKMRRSALDELSKHGIQGTRGSHAIGHLVDVSGKIRLNEDGEPVFFNGEFDQPLSEGLEEWANSDEAALYKPPRPDQGSGERGGGVRIPEGDDPRSAALRAISALM